MIIGGYPVFYFKSYEFMHLFDGDFKRKSNAGHFTTIYEKIITLDTETYVYPDKEIGFITDWTITIENDACLYGNHVKDLIKTIDRILDTLHADDKHLVRFYVHNFPYDYMFLRNHLLERYGEPDRSLAVKSHRYIFMQWSGQGLEFRDSQILTQRSLERLCVDMGTQEKAVGTWDYKKIRTPDSKRTAKEIAYVCTDTIALCKALRKYITDRGCNICNVPLTNTGFIRNRARTLSRKDKKWRKQFESMQLDLKQYKQLLECYHGGYTHANRYFVNRLINKKMMCYDFASSYPSVLCYEKYPMTNFVYTDGLSLDDILELKEDFAFSGYLRLTNVRLKKDCAMPPMAFHKAKVCIFPENSGKTLKSQYAKNLDNGKIVNADIVIYPFTDPDLEVILSSYTYEKADVASVMRAKKDFLPDWITNYIMELYKNKSTLKHSDPVLYMISKGELNGIYGMMVQRIIQEDIKEDFLSGAWSSCMSEEKEQELLDKFYKSRNSFLPYQWGVWCTAYAQKNLFELGACTKKWIYSDTDSVKGFEWDKKKLDNYNEKIIAKSNDRNLGLVNFNGELFRLGIADFDGEYTRFITMGSKRYAYIEKDKLHITVAGVPKDGIFCMNDIYDFHKGFKFTNSKKFQENFKKENPTKVPKWKMKTEYINISGIQKIKIDGCMIEYGCSIRLSDTEYELDHTIPYDQETGLPVDFDMDVMIYD